MVILFATDRSREAQDAGRMIQQWHLRPTDAVTSITVLEGGATNEQPAPDPANTIPVPSPPVKKAPGDDSSCITASWRTLERQGDPTKQILALAEEIRADLIVLGAKGMSRVRRLLIGSVAASVARHAACSVMVVRRPIRPIRSLLVATDGSAPAHAAIEALVTLPFEASASCHVLLVLAPPELESFGRRADLYLRLQELRADAWQRQRQAAESVCVEVSERLARAGIQSSWEVAEGDAEKTIVATAKRRSVDLVVVGSRGRSALVEILLGSVSHAVLVRSPSSVLIGRSLKATGPQSLSPIGSPFRALPDSD